MADPNGLIMNETPPVWGALAVIGISGRACQGQRIMKVLIIEDDRETVEYVNLAFKLGWPEVELISTPLGEEGIELVERESPDIVILDLGLPDVDGSEVLKRIRLFSTVPIIIMTVRKDEASIVKELECGADKYLSKPFDQMELLAQVRALARRSGPKTSLERASRK